MTRATVPPAVAGIKRRWLASVILATADTAAIPALPFQRGNRRRPAGLAAARPRPAAAAR